VRRWWHLRISPNDLPTSTTAPGLSRQTRITAQGLARLLQVAYASPFMPELMSSLPIAGLDGTLKRSRATPASAHLKTGSLRDVTALAGYVLTSSGKRLCLVAIANHANAPAVRPAGMGRAMP
jgi:D-alanyl-D-alanine carboxypeptidase/D-alanyl-D-alanine-endopeptidase (penicillin-binding protein 4)